jgi:hypothetical protein
VLHSLSVCGCDGCQGLQCGLPCFCERLSLSVVFVAKQCLVVASRAPWRWRTLDAVWQQLLLRETGRCIMCNTYPTCLRYTTIGAEAVNSTHAQQLNLEVRFVRACGLEGTAGDY